MQMLNTCKPFIDTLKFGVNTCFKLDDIKRFGFKKLHGISMLQGSNNFLFRYYYGNFMPCLKMNGSLPKVVTGCNANHIRSKGSRIKYLNRAEEALLPFSPISLRDFLLSRIDVTLDINCKTKSDKHNLIKVFKHLPIENIKKYETGSKVKSSDAYGFSVTCFDKGEEMLKSGVMNNSQSSNVVRVEFKFSKQYLKNTFKKLDISRECYNFLLNDNLDKIVDCLFNIGIKSFERKMPKSTWCNTSCDKKHKNLLKYNKYFAAIYEVLRPVIFDDDALLLYNILLRANNENSYLIHDNELMLIAEYSVIMTVCETLLCYLELPKINDSG